MDVSKWLKHTQAEQAIQCAVAKAIYRVVCLPDDATDEDVNTAWAAIDDYEEMDYLNQAAAAIAALDTARTGGTGFGNYEIP